MLPRVIIHTAVSADGRIDGFTPDLGTFYGLVATWKEDVTLAGSDTLLAAAQADAPATEEPLPAPDPGDTRPLLAIVDSRGRVHTHAAPLAAGYWRQTIALCSQTTPARHMAYLAKAGIPALVAGQKQVDLKAALAQLAAQYGARVVRVESGGVLSGVLLRAGLVSEVSVLVHPVLVGGSSARSFYRAADLGAADSPIAARLISAESVGAGIVWLRYALG
jgi:2,5-diamino-6-(ribosylamino)-4(3H)-pyrimidinone 5'-phosphate reductase